jgi:hypothetical protein
MNNTGVSKFHSFIVLDGGGSQYFHTKHTKPFSHPADSWWLRELHTLGGSNVGLTIEKVGWWWKSFFFRKPAFISIRPVEMSGSPSKKFAGPGGEKTSYTKPTFISIRPGTFLGRADSFSVSLSDPCVKFRFGSDLVGLSTVTSYMKNIVSFSFLNLRFRTHDLQARSNFL